MDDRSPVNTTVTPRILVVDDDRAVRNALQVNLSKSGYAVTLAASAQEALAAVAESLVDVVLTDVAMPGMTGIDLLKQMKTTHPDVRVVVMTGYGSVSDAVTAMKAGADDYIIKPVSKDTVLMMVEKALKEKALLAEVIQLRRQVAEKFGFDQIIGATPAIVEIFEQIQAVADTYARVLIQGPTGTGKELIAHAIHYRSARSQRPFIRVNCAALPEGVLESELFGHEKGAFTGAIRQHRGRFEQAHGGTLFLDEIGEISQSVQVKLLRALEAGEIQRVGGSETLRVDVRVISATNRELQHEILEGRFREDLYYRLNVFTLQVPSLAERRDDIPLLVDHFVTHYCGVIKKPKLKVDAATMQRLINYHWPGNVRELQHVIERAVILSRDKTLSGVKLPEIPNAAESPTVLPRGVTLEDALMEYERQMIIRALKEGQGVQAQAARMLGISRSNLNYRIKRLGISIREIVYE